MNILTVKNLTKGFIDHNLFENISFTINEEEKIGLIGTNGTGKSTLLKIISNQMAADSGEIQQNQKKKIAYLSQQFDLEDELTVLEQVFKSDSPKIKAIREYEHLMDKVKKMPEDKALHDSILKQTEKINQLDAWTIEAKIKTILTKLGISDFDKKISTLSGGQKKRVALATALINPCDLLILDEPTNHLDNETIEWLEEYLKEQKLALLMVTHDRYFLDRVVNKIIELDNHRIYEYSCSYSEFIQEKQKREALEQKKFEKQKSLYKKELEWIRAGVQARSTKQKARIDRFKSLKKKVHSKETDTEELSMPVAYTRLGKKVIHLEEISKGYGNLQLISNFSHKFLPNDRVAVVGKNGVGKSTLIKIIADELTPDTGSVDRGSTVEIGYFSQHMVIEDEDLRAIDYIKNTAEYMKTYDGRRVSASSLMEQFMFSSEMQYSYINKLSGGERRRLQLLSVLMRSPNVLILDEPTNDLDIDTLRILESYLDEFNGVVIVVSHDRYFINRVCDQLIVFHGEQEISLLHGDYEKYHQFLLEKNKLKKAKTSKKKSLKHNRRKKKKKTKLSYHEKKELEALTEEIPQMEKELGAIEEDISEETSDYIKLQELSEAKEMLELELLEKMERYEKLLALQASFNNKNM